MNRLALAAIAAMLFTSQWRLALCLIAIYAPIVIGLMLLDKHLRNKM